MARIICIGEAMKRYMSKTGKQSIGGAELNVAVALSSLGWKTTWLSVLPKNDEGMIAAISQTGVESVIIRNDGEVGKYTVIEDEQRVQYQRDDSAFALMDPDAINIRTFMQGHEWVHITGITPFLGQGPRALWNRVMIFSELDDIKLSLDINHRSALCSRDELWDVIEPHLRKVHLLTMSKQDLHWIASKEGMLGSEEEICKQIARKWLINRVGCTFKETQTGRLKGWEKRWSIVATPSEVESSRENKILHRPIEHLGSGDAWVAGIIQNEKNADLIAVIQQSTFGDFFLSNNVDCQSAEFKIISRIVNTGIIPIIRSSSRELAEKEAERVVVNGAQCIEFSLDTPDCIQLLGSIKEKEILKGIGTVKKPIKEVLKSYKSGARFFLSPNNPEEFIRECKMFNSLAIPGVSSIEEAEVAVSQGAVCLKLFHSKNDWSIEEMVNIRRLMPEIVLIPVGGVMAEDVETMFEIGMDAVGIGDALQFMDDAELQTLFSK
ncbi:MAG: hypothetical protein HN696_05820 [Euryarchaeota archaeon]|jgi:2-keto-3-deoxy-6-phosphogluconate aldolase/sugar/nucleoside kinase (ribokinase family)|nr:hypothetical protein [Euryarchaeota archaeon]